MSLTHVKKVDMLINETCKIITGCLKPTNTNKLFTLCDIDPPDIRRQVIVDEERNKCDSDGKHPVYGYIPQDSRLNYRQSFVYGTTGTLKLKPDEGI